jgi:PIN domain nuclease of toxin-antitoxin system
VILLDTHVLIWYLTQPEKMSKAGARAVEAGFAGQGAGIVDLTLWEIAMFAHKKRVVFTRDVKEWLRDLRLLPHFRCLPVSASVAALSTQLPGRFHQDPVDRLLVATSIDQGVPLVTKDDRIRRYPHVQTIW